MVRLDYAALDPTGGVVVASSRTRFPGHWGTLRVQHFVRRPRPYHEMTSRSRRIGPIASLKPPLAGQPTARRTSPACPSSPVAPHLSSWASGSVRPGAPGRAPPGANACRRGRWPCAFAASLLQDPDIDGAGEDRLRDGRGRVGNFGAFGQRPVRSWSRSSRADVREVTGRRDASASCRTRPVSRGSTSGRADRQRGIARRLVAQDRQHQLGDERAAVVGVQPDQDLRRRLADGQKALGVDRGERDVVGAAEAIAHGEEQRLVRGDGLGCRPERRGDLLRRLIGQEPRREFQAQASRTIVQAAGGGHRRVEIDEPGMGGVGQAVCPAPVANGAADPGVVAAETRRNR